MNKLTISLSLLLLSGAAQAADLTVYTYDSFVSEWGQNLKRLLKNSATVI